ncbi:MAG: hypothetical protein O3B42_06295 [Actinomycetota bacterium]|nr:hypothetical protein [Actinomycetota bacterium]
MPRPNKPIERGSLADPISASRPSSWRKHAGPEFASQYEPDGVILVDPMTHESVSVVDVTDAESLKVSIAPGPIGAGLEPLAPPVTLEWKSERSIDGRTYHRVDEMVPVTS